MALTEQALRQRQHAARKHGIIAFQARGESALDAPERSRLAEISEATQTREGAIGLVRERVAASVMLAELCEAWIRDQAERSIPLDKMTMMNRISTFQETARRCLALLVAISPETGSREDITNVLSGETKDK